MQIGSWWAMTEYSLTGPWHVASSDNHWYIVNMLNGNGVKIGKFRSRGRNFCDEAKDEARERNEQFFKDHVTDLPLFIGKHPSFDKILAEKLKGV